MEFPIIRSLNRLKIPSDKFVFYIIVIAQFCGTSVWFAGNAALPQLQQQYNWGLSSLGYITSATQIGFIAGTLCFAIAGLADRISPSKLFFICSFLVSASNSFCLLDLSHYPLVLMSRVLTGFFLAGIYPVGMKIASDWNEKGLGHWLGTLVGALVIGTAFPHGLKVIPGMIRSEILLISVSVLAILGGLLIGLLVPDGPFRKKGSQFSFRGLGSIFRNRAFRTPAFGYFGHMWELYAFWAFIPWMISIYESANETQLPVLMPFMAIGSGALGCIAGGRWSQTVGSYRVALYALTFSGLCCLLSPFMFYLTPAFFCIFMVCWGFAAAADSPQFSALVANSAPPILKGSALTMVICIGFFITIISIQMLNALQNIFPARFLLILLFPGPLFGVIALISNPKRQ